MDAKRRRSPETDEMGRPKERREGKARSARITTEMRRRPRAPSGVVGGPLCTAARKPQAPAPA